MLNRRSFFKAFGGAILGTAIALKLPETIVARIPSIANGIPFHTLLRAYHLGAGTRTRVLGGKHPILKSEDLLDEPRRIYLSERRYQNTLDKLCQYGNLMGKQVGIGNNAKSFRFMGALVFPVKFISDDDIGLVGEGCKRIIRIDDVHRERKDRLAEAKKNFEKYLNV